MTTKDVCELLISQEEENQFKTRPTLSKKAMVLSLAGVVGCGMALYATVSGETRPSAQTLFFEGVNEKLSLQQDETVATNEPESDPTDQASPDTDLVADDQSVPEEDQQIDVAPFVGDDLTQTVGDGLDYGVDQVLGSQPEGDYQDYEGDYDGDYQDDEEDFGEWDQEALEGPEGEDYDQDWQDLEGEGEWNEGSYPYDDEEDYYGDDVDQEGDVQGLTNVEDDNTPYTPTEVDPVSLLTKDEIAASIKSGNLTEEAKAIVSSVKAKIQGNKALALSIIHELQSLQWAGAGAGTDTPNSAKIGNKWAEQYGAGDWASQYGAGAGGAGAGGDWASQYGAGAGDWATQYGAGGAGAGAGDWASQYGGAGQNWVDQYVPSGQHPPTQEEIVEDASNTATPTQDDTIATQNETTVSAPEDETVAATQAEDTTVPAEDDSTTTPTADETTAPADDTTVTDDNTAVAAE